MAKFNYDLVYEDLKADFIDLQNTEVTFTAPCGGVVYIDSDGIIKFVSTKQDATNEIKEQPFFK